MSLESSPGLKLTTGLLAAGLCLTACGSGSGKTEVNNDIKTCGQTYIDTINPSNVEPTYLSTDKNYAAEKDPQKLFEYQEAHATKYSYIGLRSLVCNLTVDKTWDGTPSKQTQVLTQEAIAIAKELQNQ